MLRKFLLPFFAFILLLGLLHPVNVFAQTPAPSAAAADTGTTDNSNNTGFTVSPDQKEISDLTPKVTITFPSQDLQNYFVCLRNDLCQSGSYELAYTPQKLMDVAASAGLDKKLFDSDYVAKNTNKLDSNNSITVCGKNNDELKTDCKDGRDYFHAGNFYLATVFVEQGSKYVAVQKGGFYVSRGTPIIKVTADKYTTGAHFKVDISQNSIRPGGQNRNNYEVVLRGPGGINKNECDHIDAPITPMTFDFPLMPGKIQHYVDADDQKLIDSGYVVPGVYTFRINEQINEGDAHRGGCDGGFTYAAIACTISGDLKKPGSCGPIAYDPDKKDARQIIDLLDRISGNADTPFLPCEEGKKGVKNPLDCNAIDTAIGSIKLDPIGFITRIFQIVLAIAGVGALFLIIYSGYRMLLSRGNKEMIQGARETITAAIIGLLFIIFSLVILSVITGNILKLPGFS